jgi:serine/threonine protein kinase/ABC-type branched-subunit amino acid transport system substrate-binding protein
MSYCINPRCIDRQNSDQALRCRACNTQLSFYKRRFQIVAKISKPNHNPEWEVFKVTDVRGDGQPKVLKTLTSTEAEFTARFKREIEILKNSKNSGIPAYVLDFHIPAEGSRPELHCLVMESIDGDDLETWLETNGKLTDEPTALTWLNKITIILAYIHSKKHFHRDIKPSNIMLKANGELALIDFGIVRQITSTVNQHGASTYAYTPIYAAPEQVAGKAVPQSDFYALGKTFIHLLTGQRPIQSELDLHQWEYETDFPTSGLIPLINWLLEEDLQQRPQTPGKILEAISYISTRKVDSDFPNRAETTSFIDRLKHYRETQTSRQPQSARKLAALVTVSAIAGILLYHYFPRRLFLGKSPIVQPATELISFGDREIKQIYGSDKIGKPGSKEQKLAGIKLFNAGNYKAAYQKFDELHQLVKNSPDALIYMNNAKVRYWHQKKPTKPLYTIAAAVPARIERGQHVLFGVAQNQHQVVNRTANLEQEPDLYLEVGIADDLNKPEQAIAIAKQLTEQSITGADNNSRSILATVGHDSSEVTCEVLPIYAKAGLPLVSSTSSMNNMRAKCGDQDQIFFRVISSARFESRSLIKLLKQKNIRKLQVTSFYKKREKIGFSRDLFEIFKQDFKQEFGQDLGEGFDLSDLDNGISDIQKGIDKAKTSNVILLFSDEKTDTFNAFNNAIKILETLDPRKVDLVLGSNPLLSAEIGPKLLQKWHGKLVVAVDWDDDPQCSDRAFVATAIKLWGGSINRTTAASYEATQVLSELLKGGNNTTRSQVKEGLINVNNVKSQVFNNKDINFDRNGDRSDIRQKILLTPTGDDQKLEFKPINKNQCSL